MFEKYTEKARRAIFFARYEAGLTGARAIAPEHLLLGVVREDKVLAHVLFVDAVSSIDAIRMEIAMRSRSEPGIHTSVDLPLAESAKSVLTRAASESSWLNHTH